MKPQMTRAIDDTLEKATKSVLGTRRPPPQSLPQSRLLEGDCLDVLPELASNSIHLVLTDPPYFLDGLDNGWKKGIGTSRGTGAIGGLPVGMKFDPDQGRKLQAFINPIANQLFRVLKPGGFVLMFSAPRLSHRMAVALEDNGFEIRDMYAWRFTKKAQFKAFSMDHFIAKRKDLTEKAKKQMLAHLGGRKTPQLRPEFEAIICAQKPREGTLIDNWGKHETGLIDSEVELNGSGRKPSTVMTVEKPEREKYNKHLTPKPLDLCAHLIKLFTIEGQVVLDPFLGSGTTCVAAQKTNRYGIGIDINPEYLEIADKRMRAIDD